MKKISRRDALKTSGLAGLSAGLSLGFPHVAKANGWGEIPAGVWDPAYTGVKVLEIFCYSGMSQWENFWVAEDATNNPDWKNFATQIDGTDWHCPGSPSPVSETIAFGNDADGNPIRWGPSTKPLWRPDIFNRARMVTVGHDLLPHEAATPLALTGRRLGNPRLAGLGTAIQHRAMDLAPRDVPYAFVLSHNDLGLFQFVDAPPVATGLHPGFSQPLLIRIGDASFQTTLQRNHMTAEADQLFEVYVAHFRDWLRWLGTGSPVRSAGFQSYDSAAKFLLNAENLDTLLGGNLLDVIDGPVCATYSSALTSPTTPTTPLPNRTRTALQVATHVLTTGDAKYACVFDRGLLRGAADSPYDTHTGTHLVEVNATNAFNLFTNLAELIDPTGSDPTKLNLDEVMIVINTEFGRTPAIEFASAADDIKGRNHHPYGYVSVLIGGPIVSRGIAGALSSAGFLTAGNDYSPTDVHGAAMLAAGVDPFAGENFGVLEFTSNVHDGTEQGTRLGLKQQILGL